MCVHVVLSHVHTLRHAQTRRQLSCAADAGMSGLFSSAFKLPLLPPPPPPGHQLCVLPTNRVFGGLTQIRSGDVTLPHCLPAFVVCSVHE